MQTLLPFLAGKHFCQILQLLCVGHSWAFPTAFVMWCNVLCFSNYCVPNKEVTNPGRRELVYSSGFGRVFEHKTNRRGGGGMRSLWSCNTSCVDSSYAPKCTCNCDLRNRFGSIWANRISMRQTWLFNVGHVCFISRSCSCPPPLLFNLLPLTLCCHACTTSPKKN